MVNYNEYMLLSADIPFISTLSALALSVALFVAALCLLLRYRARRGGAIHAVMLAAFSAAFLTLAVFSFAVAAIEAGCALPVGDDVVFFDGAFAVPAAARVLAPFIRHVAAAVLLYACLALALANVIVLAVRRYSPPAALPVAEEGDGYCTVKGENRPFMPELEPPAPSLSVPAFVSAPETFVPLPEGEKNAQKEAPVGPFDGEAALPIDGKSEEGGVAESEIKEDGISENGTADNVSAAEEEKITAADEEATTPITAPAPEEEPEEEPAEEAKEEPAAPYADESAEENKDRAAEEPPKEEPRERKGESGEDSEDPLGEPSVADRAYAGGIAPERLPERKRGKAHKRIVTDMAAEAFNRYFAGMSDDERAALSPDRIDKKEK